jgi:hypothetical protein
MRQNLNPIIALSRLIGVPENNVRFLRYFHKRVSLSICMRYDIIIWRISAGQARARLSLILTSLVCLRYFLIGKKGPCSVCYLVSIAIESGNINVFLYFVFQMFNSRTCQLVLGAGALQLVGLKTITAKHLGIYISIFIYITAIYFTCQLRFASEFLRL